MTALIARIVAVVCTELGLPPAVAAALIPAALSLAGMIDVAKLEGVVFAVMREGAKWLISRPPGPESTAPDLGGNVPAAFGTGPPIITRPEPDENATLGGNVPAAFGCGPPVAVRTEPEDGRNPPP